MNATDEQVTIPAEAMLDWATALLIAEGLPPKDAAVVAYCLVRADLRGTETHGIVRLPVYLDRVRRGFVNPAPKLEARRTSAASAHMDGQNGLGFVVATHAVTVALDLARAAGVGLVGVSASSHFGMAANYLLQAAEAGLAAVVLSNGAPAMPPWGGREAMFGTSPLGAAVPLGDRPPFVLDMSMSVVARGRIRQAEREGRPLEPGQALDEAGRPTTDAAAAMRGVLLPIGGAKGASLAMWIDLLCGALTGAAFAGGVGDQYREPGRPQDVGHVILVFRPDLFLPPETLAGRFGEWVARFHDAPPAPDAGPVRIPGERGATLEAERRRAGLVYLRADLADLIESAHRTGVPMPEGLDAPV